MRKVVQIAAYQSGLTPALFALTEDGSIWEKDAASVWTLVSGPQVKCSMLFLSRKNNFCHNRPADHGHF